VELDRGLLDILQLGIFQKLLKNSQIGIGFKALHLKQLNLESKLGQPKKADKGEREFTGSTASAYRLSTSIAIHLELYTELPGLELVKT
jgi:hypothetical protein